MGKKKDKRFKIVHSHSIGIESAARIIQDKETGVLYLYFGSGYGGGLTPLLNREGKPIVDSTYTEWE